MMGRERKGKLTATANSGIGSGNLYSAAVQMWVGKEEEGSVRVGERRRGVEGLLEKKDGGREGLWKGKKREGRRLKEGDVVVHAMFICCCCCSGLGRT